MYSASVSNIDSAVAGTAYVCSERGSLHLKIEQRCQFYKEGKLRRDVKHLVIF